MYKPLKIWLKAFRLRTLPLALSSTFLGSFMAYSHEHFSWMVFLFAVLTTLSLQILSNLANDYGDAKKGTDNNNRIGPQRVTQSGMVTKSAMKRNDWCFCWFGTIFRHSIDLFWFAPIII
jgi:1,4-dihydroxy-2-naphthoate octaprenyltransferase